MIETRQSVDIEASSEATWDLLSDFEGAWERSNPAHRGCRVLSDPKRPIREGLRWWQREKVGWWTAEFVATVHDVIPQRQFKWSTRAKYRLGPIAFPIDEGGEVRIEPTDAGCQLSHRVWGKLPPSVWGRVLEWIAARLMSTDADVAEHTRIELEYFKRCLERPPCSDRGSRNEP